MKTCNTSIAAVDAIGTGLITLLSELQRGVGDSKLIITKDQFGGGSEAYVNSIFPLDTFCSCYSCTSAGWAKTITKHGATYAQICQTQILEAIKLGKRGQVALLHGEVNSNYKDNTSALAVDFTFSLASFLIAASPSSFFGYSNGWYYNGTTWHDEYDKPLGAPLGLAKQGSGTANMTWTREFASGTTVELDVVQHMAKIHWGGKHENKGAY